MFDVLGDINWLSVLAAFAAYFVLGGLWYPVLFAKPYAASLGRPAAEVKEITSAPLFLAGPAVCVLVILIASAVLLEALGVTEVGDALVFGLIVGIGYLAANTTNIAINPNFPHPFAYSAITSAYHLVGILIASVLLVVIG